MRRWFGTGMVLAFGLGWGVSPTSGQVRERDVTITGPRGRSIERSITTERGPGFVDRQVNITRPGGTFHSNTMLARPGGVPFRPPGWGGGGWGWGGGGWGWGPRPVIINNGGGGIGPLGALAIGGGMFGLGALTGAVLSSPPPPPPVVVAPVQPVAVAPAQPANVVYNPPQPYNSGQSQPPTVVIDPVADAMGRLRSNHDHSRRDGAYTLGRLRDPRAVPVLVERLKYDSAKEVRIASAVALGEIGDPRAAIFLERATIYDKKQEVRDAAATALTRMPREVPVQAQGLSPNAMNANIPQGATVPNLSTPPATTLEPIENVPPPPTPATGPAFRSSP